MNIILWIILGALAGWIASMIVGKNREMGAIANILTGIIGAAVGGWIADALGIGAISGFNLGSLLIAIAGSVVLLVVINLIRRALGKQTAEK